jgi:hypothetical protein
MRQSAANTNTAAPFEIEVAEGRLLDIIDLAEEAMLAAATQRVFQRAGMLVRLKRIDSPEDKRGIARPAGALIIAEATPEAVRCEMARTARWIKFDGRRKQFGAVDPPLRYALALLAQDEWNLLPLLATIEAPTLRRDGSVLQKLGYDDVTGLYFDSAVRFPEVPTNPSRTDAEAALQKLGAVVKDFPFVDGAATSVALAAILTAVVRRSLPSAPMFLFDAPTRGSGKTLLSRLVSIIATGREPTIMTYTGEPDEDRKRITSALLAADPVLSFDNISEPLEGDTLCTVLTVPTYEDRLLGGNTIVRLPTCATFLGNGNNIVVRGDMTARVLMCRIDPAVENPEQREFNYDILAMLHEQRPELVAAALIIMRAYVVAGCPRLGIKPYGRFEAWSDMVRAPLVWLGCADPCDTRKQVEDDDPELEALATLLTVLHDKYGSQSFTVAELAKVARNEARVQTDMFGDPGQSAPEPHSALKDALEAISWRGEINPRAIGKVFTKHKDRIIAGLRLRKGKTRQRAVLWQVEAIQK